MGAVASAWTGGTVVGGAIAAVVTGKITLSGAGTLSRAVCMTFCGTSTAALPSSTPLPNPAPISRTEVATPAKKMRSVEAIVALPCARTQRARFEIVSQTAEIGRFLEPYPQTGSRRINLRGTLQA